MPVWLIAFLLALVVGSLVEYWGHRAMHTWLLKKKHALHHRDGDGQGWLGEFVDYFVGSLFIVWVGFLYSVEAGIAFLAGGVVFAMWAAYSHQLQHEQPDLCFWLRRPVHYLHHHGHMWHYNFGISMDLWDRVFGTYKVMDWQRKRRFREVPLRAYFQIHWLQRISPHSNQKDDKGVKSSFPAGT
jgi:sterol desaturase/sphingolipid hydroxylase (fatty acid hydroxylase superfamily)